jgi:uncharacterized linocin/CFP29 family protein
MSDLMMRSTAPIDEGLWAKIDEMVLTVAKKNLVGRRFLPMVGPLGWGVEVAPSFGFTVADGAAMTADKVAYLPLQEIKAEFLVRAKNLAMAADTPFALDLGAVAIAAGELAKAEDKLILGALVKGAAESPLGDWAKMGEAVKAIASATAKLLAAGFDGPYAVVMGPADYAMLAGMVQYGAREMEMVEKLARAGLFVSPSWGAGHAGEVLVVSPQAWNMDLVVGQDMVTAYLGNEGLDHRFRVFETLAVRLKRPGASCILK